MVLVVGHADAQYGDRRAQLVAQWVAREIDQVGCVRHLCWIKCFKQSARFCNCHLVISDEHQIHPAASCQEFRQSLIGGPHVHGDLDPGLRDKRVDCDFFPGLAIASTPHRNR